MGEAKNSFICLIKVSFLRKIVRYKDQKFERSQKK